MLINNKSLSQSRYNNNIIVNNSIEIETNIIGYKSQGEAILIFIYADNCISYSILVDCYELSDVNIVEDILNEHNILKLIFLCWTHPDTDHSKGMKKIIENFVDSKTQIWIPEGVDDKEIKCGQEVQELFKFLKESIIHYNDINVYSASDKKDMTCYDSYCFTKGLEQYPLNIYSYAPNSMIIRKQNYNDLFLKNDRSIFLILTIGDVEIFLTGDIENETIKRLSSCIDSNHIHIMKIPHHGSSTSTEMISLCEEGSDIACSTVYRMGSSSLPMNEILNEYSSLFAEVYCTGNMDKEQEYNKFGIVIIKTDVINLTYAVELKGNAIAYK